MSHLCSIFPNASGALITDPTWRFSVVLCVILFAPLLLRRLRIPHIVGLILAGEMIVGQKVSGTLKAFKVEKGVEFEGAEGTVSSQTAGENGAWIIKEKDTEPRMIQDAEFKAAYIITKRLRLKNPS